MSETVSTSTSSAPSQGSTGTGQTSSAPSTGFAQTGGNSSAASSALAGWGVSEKQSEAKPEQAPQAPSKRYLEGDAEEALVKLKIDGQEQELTVKELKRLTSLERASQKRMAESAKVQKQYQAMVESLKNNPADVLKQLGRDPDAFAEELLARKYELSQMSPVERENLELKQRVEAQERMEMQGKRTIIDDIKKLSDKVPENLDKYSKEDLAQYRDHLTSVNNQAQAALQQELISAWEETKLPKHKTWGTWMAMEMMNHEKKTGQPLQAKEAAAKVKADYLKFSRSVFGGMDANAIQEALGKEIVQKLIDHRVQGVTDTAVQGFQSKSPAPAVSDNKKYMSELEWRAWLKK